MAGGSGRESESFKHHKYKGMSNAFKVPSDGDDECEPDELTIAQIKKKYHHLRRVAEGVSKPVLRQHEPDEYFSNDYPEFLSFYSRGQLQHLEKLFIMADQDRDGQLNKFEVKYWMEKQGNPISQPEVKEIFKVADENKDGYLSFREFLIFCQRIELKNIPSDNRGIAVHGMIKDPTGQSQKYPPPLSTEHQECGVRKIASTLKSFTQVRGNIGGAVDFFEREIAKEYDSATRSRKTFDAVMDKKRKGYNRSTTKKKSITPTTVEKQANKTYRTSLHIPINDYGGEVDVPETQNQKYRTSLHIQPQENTDPKWYPHVSQKTYNTSFPYIKRTSGDNESRRHSVSPQRISSQNRNKRFSSNPNEKRASTANEYENKRFSSIASEKRGSTEGRNSSAYEKRKSSDFQRNFNERISIPSSPSEEAQVVFAANPSPKKSEDKLPRFSTIPEPPPFPQSTPKASIQESYHALPIQVIESNEGQNEEYAKNQMVETLVNDKNKAKKQSHPQTEIVQTMAETVNAGVQTEPEKKEKKISVFSQTNQPPSLHSTSVQTNPIDLVDEASGTPAFEARNEITETDFDDELSTPTSSQFQII